ncbi:MAG: hypothetical protein AAFQ14_19540 [Cyanobacteria bacterium J06621_12]
MTRLKRKPRFSLIFSLLLLLLTYSAEGWIYGSLMRDLITEKDLLAHLTISTQISLLYGIAAITIMLVVVVFTSPVSLMTVGLNRWLKSDTRAFLSIFIGAFAFAIIVQRVDIFARFLVMVSAVFLGKLDFQLMGYSRWLCSVILIILCWFGFTGGILAFYRWNF